MVERQENDDTGMLKERMILVGSGIILTFAESCRMAKDIELKIAREALAHVGRRPVRDSAGKGILRKSDGVGIGNSRNKNKRKYLTFK